MTDTNPRPAATGTVTREQMLTTTPQGHLLADGDYAVLVTAAGTGFSRCGAQLLTRWDGDPVQDAYGSFLYVRDLDRDRLWSAGHQPVPGRPEAYEARFGDGRAVISRMDDGIVTTLEVAVAPGCRAELRRVTVLNATPLERRLELTSYLEAVLNEREADAAHPGFSKLFVQTEWEAGSRTLLARRRPRSATEAPRWMYHWLCPDSRDGAQACQWETDRVRFLGRGRNVADPQALTQPLSGNVGNVLDPVLAIRALVILPPGESRTLTFGTGYADRREEALAVAGRFAAPATVEEAFQAAVILARRDREELGLSPEEGRALDQVAVDLLHLRARTSGPGREPGTVLPDPAPLLRGPASSPLVLVPREGKGLQRQVAAARAHWARNGFHPRVAFLGTSSTVAKGDAYAVVLDEGSLTADQRDSLFRAASLVVSEPFPAANPALAARTATREPRCLPLAPASGTRTLPPVETLLHNGLGGFTTDGREYVITVRPGAGGRPELPPMPWTNVIANEHFGFLTSERGTSAAWSGNSRLHRVTPWFNDPVEDPLAEAFYLRDEDTGAYWSLTPGPVDTGMPFRVRHGFGYTTWEALGAGLDMETTAFVPCHDPVKLTRIRVANPGDRPRKLSLFSYAQLVLGDTQDRAARWVDTVCDDGALFGWSLQDGPLAGQVAFAAVAADGAARTCTTDREAFLGRFGSLARPRAVTTSERLDGATGAGHEPCFAFQVDLDLAPGETREVVIALGEAGSLEEARRHVARYRERAAARTALAEVHAFWRETLGALKVRSPEPAIDLMVNGWLPYQNLSCRMWARTAYYQSGGAFGFRDQLQDASALIYLLPGLTRSQLLLHAAHQFREGDVLHWWHPPVEQGIRTRFADDLLWLPYLSAFYLESTGDWDLLDETAPYLTARALEPGEDEAYLAPEDSGERGDLYDHCCRALELSLSRTGSHGLPLMGTGDWNDGMNRVGRGGQGESIWMGFFLYAILASFLPICRRRGDGARADRYQERMGQLSRALDESGWDGGWYRRAYYDDGTPLGSASNTECRIDCLAQAWAVISRAVPEERARLAMRAVEAHLVDGGADMIRLLTPAFDTCDHDPGYIKGYIPGVRENGGQYTHGALWAVKAVAELGDVTRAAELLTMLSPVTHGRTPAQVATYQTEPYVIAADVYGVEPLVGRGGWTWYTGSAGWMYRVAIEDVFGFTLAGADGALLRPRLPATWNEAALHHRPAGGQDPYEIRLERVPAGAGPAATLDGAPLEAGPEGIRIPYLREGREHVVRIKVTA